MSKYRLIQISDATGEYEAVYFLDEDNSDDGTDYCTPKQQVVFDGIIKAELPAVFPLESELSRIL